MIDNHSLNILLNPHLHNHHEIERAYNDVRLNFMELICYDKIYQVDIDTFKTIIFSDDLNVFPEDLVFQSVKNFFITKRMDVITNLHLLLKFVRLPLVTTKYLMNEIESYAISNEKCRHQFMEAIRYHLLPDEKSHILPEKIAPRNLKKKFLSCGSWDMDTSTVIELYDSGKNNWTNLKNFRLQKRNCGFGIINDMLMIIGGYNGTSVNTVESIDLKTGRISTMASLNQPRHNIGVVVIGNDNSANIYAIGGWKMPEFLNTVERWDPISKQWSFVAPMNITRDGCGATVLDDKIYVAGGRDGNIYHNSMEVYDPITNNWKIKASMRETRSYCRIVAAGRYIYAVGGDRGQFGQVPLNFVERYDPFCDSWMTVASLTSYGIIGLGSLGDKIIAAGGFGKIVDSLEYNPKINTWTKLAPMNVGRQGVTIVEIPAKLFKEEFKWV